jgi:3'-5' exoribonuclease
VAYAGAILHDIGKVNTYTFNELGVAKQTVVEKTVGHIFCAMSLVKTAFEDGMVDVEAQFITEVLHCIAAHHGTREWGSIVEPQSLEAGIVSRMDYLSSRNGMMEKLLHESIKSGQPLQDEFTVYGDPYFASTGIKRYVAEGHRE